MQNFSEKSDKSLTHRAASVKVEVDQTGARRKRFKMNSEDYKDIFEPFEKLVEIEIRGEKFRVPENNSLLRCFQYLSLETISFGDFCWNGDCANCQIWLDDAEAEKPKLACRTIVRENMKIARLSDEIELEVTGNKKKINRDLGDKRDF